MNGTIHSASFRDPSGFVYRNDDGQLLRQINPSYAKHYRALIDSGLYDQLVSEGLLIEHQETPSQAPLTPQALLVIRPRELPFVSYPYEWSFSAWKDAALLTLSIQLRAMRHGLSLKDASAFNVQFEGCAPRFIDTLSFDSYDPKAPWSAYGQFCQHFLAPLALMAHRDVTLGRLLAVHLDGIPLDLASQLMPGKSRLRLGLQIHLHWHARMVRRHANSARQEASAPRGGMTRRGMSQARLTALLENLRSTIESLRWEPNATTWTNYYDDNSYTEQAFQQKRDLVQGRLQHLGPRTVWDLGANTGVFSRIARETGADTLALDIDPGCVELMYRQGRSEDERGLLPLCMNLTNPSPALGWAHRERDALADRGPADVALALALTHHLAIANNVPLPRVAEYLSRLCRQLIVEFVPKRDPQVQRLLRTRKDIFAGYHQQAFEAAFAERFSLVESNPVGEDGRILYFMQSKPAARDLRPAESFQQTQLATV